MLCKTTCWCVLVACLVVPMTARSGDAQAAEAEVESAADIARQVYDLLLDQYRAGTGGTSQLERLNHWSTRILQAEFADHASIGAAQPDAMKQSLDDHFERMETLMTIVAKRFDASETSKAELLSAKYFRLERRGIEQMINSMQQQMQPRAGEFGLELPKLVEADLRGSKRAPTVIDIDARGKALMEGKELTLEQLEKQIAKVIDEDARPAMVSIRAHPDCLYADLLRVISTCNKAGAQSISFTTAADQPPE